MAQRLFDKGGRDMFNAGTVTTGGTIKARLLSLNTTANLNKAITGATNATPIQLTVTSHGWSVGDIVIIRGVGGNTSANGTYRIKAQATNTIDLETIPPQGGTALSVVGSGAYTSGGTILNLSRAAASTTSTDIPAAAGGSTDVTLTSVTSTNGTWSATVPTWSSVNASTTIDAIAFYQSAATDRVFYVTDGKQLVRMQAAASATTTLQVEPLYAGIPNGTVLVFSNGSSVTLNAVANAGDTTLTIASSATIPKGHTTDAPITSANLPVTTASGSAGTFTYTPDATYGLFTI